MNSQLVWVKRILHNLLCTKWKINVLCHRSCIILEVSEHAERRPVGRHEREKAKFRRHVVFSYCMLRMRTSVGIISSWHAILSFRTSARHSYFLRGLPCSTIFACMLSTKNSSMFVRGIPCPMPLMTYSSPLIYLSMVMHYCNTMDWHATIYSNMPRCNCNIMPAWMHAGHSIQ